MTDPVATIVALFGMWVLTILFAVGTVTVLGAIGGWVVMIALGDLHGPVSAVPALGYLAATSSMCAIGVVGALVGTRGGASFRGKTS